MKLSIVALCVLLVSAGAFGQEEPKETRTLTQQYKALNSEMQVVDGYRTVRLFVMDKFWGTVIDSLRAEKSLRIAAEQKLPPLEKRIGELESKLSTVQESKADLTHDVDHISVAGIDFKKGTFTVIAFLSVAVLAGLLVLALLSTRMSYRAVKDMKRLYENTSMEFEHYKHNAVEKEIKLSRELQDYRNKYSEVST